MCLYFIGCSKSDDVEIKKIKVFIILKWIFINEFYWIRIGYKIWWYVKNIFVFVFVGRNLINFKLIYFLIIYKKY